MSATSSPKEEIAEFKVFPLITGTCASGYGYEYYDVGYSSGDHEDIVSSICGDN